jgi:uncharacterized protein (TIGR00106 family)
MMKVAILQISVVPIGTASTSISSFVAGCVKELEKFQGNIRYELTAMGTILEGDLEEILVLARRMHEVPFLSGAQRVLTTIKIDDRRDISASIEQKIRSVQENLKDAYA